MTTNSNITIDTPLTRPEQSAVLVTGSIRLVGWLVGVYLVLTWATAVSAVVLAATGSSAIGQEASVHAVILALVSILTLVFTANLLRGKPRADLRLRIIAIILAVALIVTAIILPLPIWMLIGHAIGAVLLIVMLVVLWPHPTTSTGAQLSPDGILHTSQ